MNEEMQEEDEILELLTEIQTDIADHLVLTNKKFGEFSFKIMKLAILIGEKRLKINGK